MDVPETIIIIIVLILFRVRHATDMYTLSLHDALPIWDTWLAREHPEKLTARVPLDTRRTRRAPGFGLGLGTRGQVARRSEEHTSELQSHSDIVCRLLIEKKNLIKHIRVSLGTVRHRRQ